MKRLLTTTAAAFAAICAFASNISGVAPVNATQVDDTATYQATPVYAADLSTCNLGSGSGWVAGLQLTWNSNQQVATTTSASVSNNVAGVVVPDFTVGYASSDYDSSCDDESPSGSGFANTFTYTTSGKLIKKYTHFLETTTWYFLVTPDIMKACAQQEKDYEVTLTIGENTFTAIVPLTVTLVDDNEVQLYPIAEQIDISGEELMFSPGSSFVYDATEKTVAPTLTVNGLTATFDIDTESSTLSATEIGTYSVTVNGTGDFKGTATATWSIVNTTGEPTSVTASAAGSMTNEGNDFTLSDPSKLEYDSENEVWYAGIKIAWPMEKKDWQALSWSCYAYYVTEDSVRIKAEDGIVECVSATESYKTGPASSKDFTCVSYTTWKVPLTPAIIEAALAEEKTSLTYTINAGAFVWGDETEGDPDGVAFRDYRIIIPLEGISLFDENGRQVYPPHEHDWSYGLSEDGTTLTAKCGAAGCFLSQSEDGLSISIGSKDATNPDYAEGHYRDGKPAMAVLNGEDEFALTDAAIGDVGYAMEGGAEIEGEPVEPGRYEAFAVITADGSQGESGSWTIRVGGLEILAGEASVNGVHVKDASEYLERATGDTMLIAAGRSYTASKTYQTPAKYGILNLSCGVKTYDLAGFTVTAAVDRPLFENNGKLVIKDSSEDATGAIAANPESTDDTLIVNTGTLTIEGGTFRGTIVNDGGTVSITGGRFSVKPDPEFVADGYDLVRRGSHWSVEKHEHDYRMVVVGGRLAIATCCNVLADDSLQISHCDSRQLVGILGIRKSFTGLTKGVPALSVDYDRKEHPAEFYAINMTALNAVITDTSLLGVIRDIVENVDFENIAETDVLNLLSVLAQNENFYDVLANILGIYVEAGAFETLTGFTPGEIEYTKDGEPFDGVPCEAGDYTARMTIAVPGGEKTVKGSFTINEKELPIETDGHPTHSWSFDVDGAKLTATCPGSFSILKMKWIDCNASPMAIELVPPVEGGIKVYDAQPLEVAVSNLNTFVINTEATVSEVEYCDADGEKLEGAPTDPGVYRAEVSYSHGLADSGVVSIDLEIQPVVPTRPFAPDAFKILAGPCTPRWGVIGEDGASAVVTDSTNLVYDAATGEWSAALVIDWPYFLGTVCVPPQYTDPAHAKVETDAGSACLVTSLFLRPLSICPEEYVAKVLWTPTFTLDDIKAASDAGQDDLVLEITVGADAWKNDLCGLKTTTCRLVVPIQGFIIDDPDDPVVVDWYWIEYLGNGETSGEMQIERRLNVDCKRLADCAFKNRGFNLLGWSFDPGAKDLAGIDFADRQFVSDEFELGVTNTICAVWTTNVVVSGEIDNEAYESISSARIWGVGSTIDDSSEGRVFGKGTPWRYVFEVPKTGAYDISTKAELPDGKTTTMTAMVIAENDPEVGRKGEQSITIPVGDWSSTLDMTGAGPYAAVVGGIDNIASQCVTDAAEVAESVEVRFTVTEVPRSDSTPGFAKIAEKTQAGYVKPLDFTLAKYVNGEFSQKLHDLTVFRDGVIRLVMAFSMNGRRNFRVVRYHEEVEGDPSTGSVYELPEGTAGRNEDGEFFEYNGESNELLISGAKLSTYALVWDGTIIDQKSFAWNIDWLTGMYVPSIELEVKEDNGWASLVGNMYFMLEKRSFAKLWDGKRNKEVSDTETVDGKVFYKVKLSDRFDNDGPDSATWGAAWYDANWINAALSEVLLYAPSYWPNNPRDVPDLNNLVAYVVYESYGCKGSVKVGANSSLIAALSAPALRTAMPQSKAAINKSLALGAAVSDDADPYCRMSSFSFADGVASGSVEVGAGAVKGSLGSNVTVVLMGAKTLGGGFSEIARIACSEDGSFSCAVPEGCSFFKVKLDFNDVVR